jgi:hypothetical protein
MNRRETAIGNGSRWLGAGLGLILGSQKELSCAFAPDGPGRREDYGVITKFGLYLGVVGGGVMVWTVFTRTVAGPGFLAGDYLCGGERRSVSWCRARRQRSGRGIKPNRNTPAADLS